MSTPPVSPTLPPVLFWSPSLAAHLNESVGEDSRHGLIDLTVAGVPLAWISDGDVWAPWWQELPADRVRLVAETASAHGSTHSMHCSPRGCVNTCELFETSADRSWGAS